VRGIYSLMGVEPQLHWWMHSLMSSLIFRLCVWQHKGDNVCDLKVIRWVNEHDSESDIEGKEKEVIHVLWDGDIHLDGLED